jgi:hypothetical protein
MSTEPLEHLTDEEKSIAQMLRAAAGAAPFKQLAADSATQVFPPEASIGFGFGSLDTSVLDGVEDIIITLTDGGGSTSVHSFIVNLAKAYTIDATAADDTLIGTFSDEVISGLGGDDTRIGGPGADCLDGGTGDNTASHASSGVGVTVDPTAGTGSGGDAQGDILVNIENLIGSANDDSLTGDANNNSLDGGADGDSLDSALGDDILLWHAVDTGIDGGEDTDTLWVDSGNVDLSTFAGTITGIEQIDLESDSGTNTPTLTAQDVLDMSDTDVLEVLGDSGQHRRRDGLDRRRDRRRVLRLYPGLGHPEPGHRPTVNPDILT